MKDELKVSNRNTDPDYFISSPSPTLNLENAIQSSSSSMPTVIDINDLIKNDPHLQQIYDQTIESFSDKTSREFYDINRVIRSLIDLSQALAGASIAYAERLNRITDKLRAYTQLQTQIPVITKGDGIYDGDNETDRAMRAEINQKFGAMLEAIRANKGLEEDKAKKVQTILQTAKDAGTAASDFVGAFTDLLRGINSKITQ